jgi:hypothetical protein
LCLDVFRRIAHAFELLTHELSGTLDRSKRVQSPIIVNGDAADWIA